MLEDEILDEFYFKLSNIENSTLNLGKKVFDAKIVGNIIEFSENYDQEYLIE
jgi:hypothetical protein